MTVIHNMPSNIRNIIGIPVNFPVSILSIFLSRDNFLSHDFFTLAAAIPSAVMNIHDTISSVNGFSDFDISFPALSSKGSYFCEHIPNLLHRLFLISSSFCSNLRHMKRCFLMSSVIPTASGISSDIAFSVRFV